MSFTKRLILVFFLILCSVSLDQISKEIVRNKIEKFERISILEDIFVLTNVENKGAAMGTWSDLEEPYKTILLKVLPTLILFLLIFKALFQDNTSKFHIICMSFIVGGGLANLYDRIFLGSVTDFMFINFGLIKTGIFNVADMFISFGVLILFISMLFKKEKKTEDHSNILPNQE